MIDRFITALLIGEQKTIQEKRKAACHHLLPFGSEISFLLFPKDDLRPVSGLPNETLVDFSLLPHSSFILGRFDSFSTWVSFRSFDHLQPTADGVSHWAILEA